MDCFVALQRSSTQGSHRIRLLVHQSQAGGVIGKSGSKIKELREVLASCFYHLAETYCGWSSFLLHSSCITLAFSPLTLLVGHQEERLACKKIK